MCDLFSQDWCGKRRKRSERENFYKLWLNPFQDILLHHGKNPLFLLVFCVWMDKSNRTRRIRGHEEFFLRGSGNSPHKKHSPHKASKRHYVYSLQSESSPDTSQTSSLSSESRNPETASVAKTSRRDLRGSRDSDRRRRRNKVRDRSPEIGAAVDQMKDSIAVLSYLKHHIVWLFIRNSIWVVKSKLLRHPPISFPKL